MSSLIVTLLSVMSFVGDEYLKEKRASLLEDDLDAESNGELDSPMTE